MKRVDNKNPKKNDIFYMTNIWSSISDKPVHRITIESENEDIIKDKKGYYMFRYRLDDAKRSNYGNSSCIYNTLIDAYRAHYDMIYDAKQIAIRKFNESMKEYDKTILEARRSIKELEGIKI